MASVPARCLATRARPKSASRASPRALRRMLLGLICMWCAAGDRRTGITQAWSQCVPPARLSYGPIHPVLCADGHSFTRGGHIAVQQDGLLRVQVRQRARRVA